MTACHRLLPRLLEAPDANFQQLKQRLGALGVNARGWRLYAEFGDALFAPLAQGCGGALDGAQALALLKLLAACEVDVLPPPVLVQSMPLWLLPGQGLDCVPAGFFRALWKACVAAQYGAPAHSKAVQQLVEDEIVPCAQWYFHSGQHLSVHSSWRNASWATVRTRWQEAVHQELTSGRPMGRKRLAAAQWPVFVARVEYQGLVFQALHNSTVLAAEGQAMRHCVGDYADLCQESMLRIYAITEKRSGARVGTVSVQELRPGVWEIDALHGYANAPVPCDVEQATDALVRALDDAFRTQPQVRKEMHLVRSKSTNLFT